jgi:type VI secretion system protein ImpM
VSEARRVGWFGKLPARGDFLDRGLPKSFTDPWYAWLTNGLAAGRAAFGVKFEERYMNAPVWRFALRADAAGPQPVCGIMMPSVDMVGRHFPLTLAIVGEGASSPVDLLDGTDEWFGKLEELARKVLSDPFDFEGWARDIEALHVRASDGPLDREAEAWRFTCAAGAVDVCLLDMLTRTAALSTCCFWTEGSPFVRPGGCLYRDLPTADDFPVMLDDGQAVREEQ